jgi:putative chitobiose transport system substrate-binding protein
MRGILKVQRYSNRIQSCDLRHRLSLKHILVIIVISLFSAFFLIQVSCARKDDVPPGKTRLEFWTISLKPTYIDYINGIINEYQDQNPDVIVEWIDMPESVIMQKLMATIAGGVAPDVVNLNSNYSQILAQNYALVNMDEAVPQEKRELYFRNLWESASFEGNSYGIPWYITTRVIMYNREIFKSAGLDPDTPPKTWDDVMEYARIIRRETRQYGYMPAIRMFEDLAMHGVPIISSDKKQALFNSSEGIDVLSRYVRMKNDDIMPVETLAQGYAGSLNRYQSGNLGMIIAGPTLLLRIKSDAPGVYANTNVAPMPLGKAGVIPAATMNLVVPRASKNHDKAVDFALFVTNNDNQLAFCKLVPLLPSTIEAANDEFFETGKGDPLQDKAIKISISQLPIAVDMSLGLKNAPLLSKTMHEAVESAYYERKTPKKALDDAAERWNEILNR